MGPRRTPPDDGLKPVEAIGLNIPLVVSACAGIVAAAVGFTLFLSGLAHDLGERIGRVEYSIQTLGGRIETLTNTVDMGVSTFQADSWIKLFRANLQSVDAKLVPTVPDLPAREKR